MIQKCFENILKDPGTTLPLVLFFRFDRERKIIFSDQQLVSERVLINLYMSLWALLHYLIMNMFLIGCLNDLIIVWMNARPDYWLGIF